MDDRRYEPWHNPDRPRVFCRDCAWYGGEKGRGTHRCLHAHAQYVKATPMGMLLLWHSATERNAENDCADFQPLGWWQRFRRYHGVEISLVVCLWLVLYALLWWWGSR